MASTFSLIDSKEHVDSIAVMLWYRDNAEYLKKFMVPFFSRVEQLYPTTTFHYFIMENDSKDDTKEVLEEFMKGRKGVLIMENIGDEFEKHGVGRGRIQRITNVRNYLLNKVRGKLSEFKWVLFLDSEVYIDELNIKFLLDKNPSSQNVGVLTCNSIQVHNPEHPEHPDEDEWQSYDETPKDDDHTFMHYYDTFAFVDTQDMSHYPSCVSSSCISDTCISHRPERMAFDSLFDVRSAWGGCVMIKANLLMHPRVQWKTFTINDKYSVCEHVYLCDSIYITSGMRICVCGDVYSYYNNI
jgi:glycosyltransferase involved in cell wall biosynthesis